MGTTDEINNLAGIIAIELIAAAAAALVFWILIGPALACENRVSCGVSGTAAIHQYCEARLDPRVGGQQRYRAVEKCAAEEAVRRHITDRVDFDR